MVWSESLGRLIKKREPKPSEHPPEAVTNWEEKRKDRRVDLAAREAVDAALAPAHAIDG